MLTPEPPFSFRQARQMGFKWTKRVWEIDEPLSTAELLVLLALTDFINDKDDVCWPSIATLARMCKKSKRWVSEYLRRLEGKGFIRRIPRVGRSNYYKLVVDKLLSPEEKASEGHEESFRVPTNRMPHYTTVGVAEGGER